MDRPENQRIFPGDARRGEIEIIREVELSAGEGGRFYKDIVRTRGVEGFVESTQMRTRRPVDRDDGVVVAPIDERDRVLLVRQFRHATRMWMRELPRGGRNARETVEAAVAREIREEIGYDVRDVIPLGRVSADGAQLESVPHLVAARVRKSGAPEREETEAIDRIIPYRFTELIAACMRGDIIDAYTLATALRLMPLFDGDRWRSD